MKGGFAVRLANAKYAHHLLLSHGPRAEIEHLLAKNAQNAEVIGAQALAGIARVDQIGDEGRPVMRPFVFYDLHEKKEG